MDGQLPLHQSKIRFLNEHLSKVWSTCIWGEDQIVKMFIVVDKSSKEPREIGQNTEYII
jgi:hypothetical protein